MKRLFHDFKLLAKQELSNEQDIARLKKHFTFIPNGYLELIQEATELELMWGNDYHLRIWNLERCISIDEGYQIFKRIPHIFAFGDNGGGGFLATLYGEYIAKMGFFSLTMVLFIARKSSLMSLRSLNYLLKVKV